MSQPARHVLPLESIGELPVGQYVGLIDNDAVACLAARLAVEGLLTPIWVRRNGNAAKTPWSVIAGRHRLLAAARLGWTAIDAEVRADATSGTDELRRLQVVENLDRRTLRPIELACHVMDRWREAAAAVAHVAPHNRQSVASRQRWSAWENISQASAGQVREIDVATAKACGKSDKWVRTRRQVYDGIVVGLPDHFARLNAHPLGESRTAMERLAGLNDTARRQAADMLLTRDDWVSIDAVLFEAKLANSKGDRALPHAHDERAQNIWAKMALPQRHSFAVFVAEQASPELVSSMIDSFKKRGLL